MSSHYLDFSSCRIVPGFCKSSHICLHKIFHKGTKYLPTEDSYNDGPVC